ncbi:MarR family winged helix-turn-helix transcriptional regulator [Cryptosporangium minutisporangium]|uniref:MarR family winged helix-turn-helix transcriptional regulator n=1 Tax=Cryptosporangium minutisporangium TaxID=113569 RepID=UPI0035E8ECB7
MPEHSTSAVTAIPALRDLSTGTDSTGTDSTGTDSTGTDSTDIPAHDELAVRLRSAAGRFVRRLRAERPRHGLTMTQISALFTVANGGGNLTPRRLAEIERIQPPAATRTVAALEERGLVRRAPHPTDGRQIVLSTTPAGEALIVADRQAREAWLAARLAELDEADQAALRAAVAILDRLARA